MISSKRRVSVVSLSSLLILCAAGSARAADPPSEGNRDGSSGEPLKEQTIYIPYEELRKVFEKEGRGVFLPYERFQELWRAAREATVKPPDEAPPVEALITEVLSEAEVATDVVRVTSRVHIELLTEGWHQIPLRLGDAAITSARIGDESARIIADGGRGHRLLLERKGPEPREVELTLEYAKAFAKSPGRNSVSFEAPQAPVSRWRVRIPGAGVKVDIHPLLAATEMPVGETSEELTDETVVLAFVGAAPQVRIDWTPRAEGATGLNALVAVESFQRVWVREGVVRAHTSITYDISRAPVDKLVLEVPVGQKVVGVFDANIRQWSVERDGAVQRITVDLFEPARRRQNVIVELERFVGAPESANTDEVDVPVVRAVGAGRQQGALAVAVGEGLRVEAIRRSGLMQIDPAELSRLPSTGRATDQWALSYRYAMLPFELTLRVEKIEPQITLDALVEAVLEPEKLTLRVQAVYDIQRAGVFRLELDIPSGYTIRQGRRVTAPGVKPVKIESYHHVPGPEDRTTLFVNLREKALGRVGFAFNLHKRLDEPDLLRPTGAAAEVSVGFPRIASRDVEQASGRLVVYAPESIRLSPATTEGLRSVSFSDARKGMDSTVRHAEPSTPGGRTLSSVLSYAFGDEPFRLTLKVERRKPHVTARQLFVARVEAGVVRYTATFFYDILYSEVETLRIDVPASLSAVVQNRTSGVSEAAIDPPPEDLSDGYVALSLRGDKAFRGKVAITLAWEMEIDSLDVGKSVSISVPRLVAKGVDRAWGQIVLTKAETIDIRAAGGDGTEFPAGLRPIDPRHDLMEGADSMVAQGAARAFEFHDDWALTLTATRFQLEEIKRTSIERAYIRTVATRSDDLSVQALYRMRSARQRLTVRLPAGVEFDSDPVRINSRPVPLERGQKDKFFVPLVGQTPDTPFLLEIRYTVPSGGLRLASPEFPSEPAVQKAYLGVYLPPEWAFLGSIGPWTDELHWRFGDFLGLEPYPQRHDSDLMSWVTQGCGITANPGEAFQTDGQFFLFSTLRPLPSPDGVLTLVAANEDLLHGLIFAAVLVGGLVLIRYRAPLRFLVVGAFLSGLIMLGVFFPTFSRQITDAVLAVAIFTVIVVWLVQYFAWTRPRDPNVIASRETRERLRMEQLRAKLAPAPAAPTPKPPPPSGTLSDWSSRPDQGGGPVDEQQGRPDQGKGGAQDE